MTHVGNAMKLSRTLCLTLTISLASGFAFGKNQLQEDRERFNSLFISLADTGGADLLTCGMQNERDELIKSTMFLEAAYRKLNKGFGRADPPIEVQIEKRNKGIMSILTYGRPDGPRCEESNRYMARILIERFEAAVKNARDRLTNAGHDPESIFHTPADRQAAACPRRAQYYQDAYQSSGRVEHLICMKTALERELR